MEPALDDLRRKYIWWKAADDPSLTDRRVIAQIMDIGDYGDVQRLAIQLGEEPLRDALAHAEPGWFSPRSWHYWHYRLGIVPPDRDVPQPPTRRFQ